MPGTTIPDRLTWAVERLDGRPDQRILEGGLRAGRLGGLIADRLGTGVVISIDRSAPPSAGP